MMSPTHATPGASLHAKIADRSAIVGVIGLGYVGLPLAVEFARAGFTVIGFDINEEHCERLNAGHSPVPDVPGEEIAALIKAGKFRATADRTALMGADAISVAVPTPLGKTGDPDMSFVYAAAATVADVMHPDMLIVLESTTYPGTTREIILPLLVSKGYTAGKDVFIAFSPHRVDPGNALFTTRNTPKIVGGITPAGTALAKALYSTCVDTVIAVSSTETAELVKLLENTFRSVNIGLVNEMAIICDKLGVDVWEVIDAAATKPFGFMKFLPGPGIGGHAMPLDAHYLSWKMRSLNYKTRFIDLAGDVNTGMPAFVVEKVAHALNSVSKPMNGSRVLIVGVAYKADVDDVRESPALDVIRLVEAQGSIVSYHDPYVQVIEEEADPGVPRSARSVRRSVALTEDVVQAADAVVIITDHTSVDTQWIVDKAALIIDTRNATSHLRPGRARIIPLSSQHLNDRPARVLAPVPR
jgi:UDP-N-acetyl-D-glucosamine dehydrogenase